MPVVMQTSVWTIMQCVGAGPVSVNQVTLDNKTFVVSKNILELVNIKIFCSEVPIHCIHVPCSFNQHCNIIYVL